ncbi:hypothetical protein JOL62DRAFT_250437 [Phyllosticta paracitricarpa]|uniref:Uncharacterized protein n=1 Tax=Phyllosticta paracitricarpa TaxID=2016321 RepID=A0ABR1MYC3_9PEZI
MLPTASTCLLRKANPKRRVPGKGLARDAKTRLLNPTQPRLLRFNDTRYSTCLTPEDRSSLYSIRRMGRRGFVTAAVVFLPLGIYIGNHNKVTVMPVSQTVQKAKNYHVDREPQDASSAFTKGAIDGMKASRRALKDLDDLVDQRCKEIGCGDDEKSEQALAIQVDSLGLKGQVAGAFLLHAGLMRGMEARLLGENHPGIARNIQEVNNLIDRGISNLFVAETSKAARKGSISMKELTQDLARVSPDELVAKTVGLRFRYSFGFKSVPDEIPTRLIKQEDGSDIKWISFCENETRWEVE